MTVALSADHIQKRFGGVVALADGSLDVKTGEVLALVGANGSGKSTLGKVVTGVISPDAGEIRFDGRPIRFPNPHAARAQGITAVYQELSLVPDMSVADNLWLAHEPISPAGLVRAGTVRAETQRLLQLFAGTVRPSLQPESLVSSLPPDEKQIVEILKALSLQPRVLILDEATASLDSRQVNRLFELVEKWKAEGVAIIFVSHRMEEIFRVADRATVLRNGRTVGSAEIGKASQSEIVNLMIEGGVVERRFARPSGGAEPIERLRATGLRTQTLRGVDLTLHKGELVGLGGLRGQGQSQILLALFGAIPFAGEVRLDGQPVHFRHPRQAMAAGMAFAPGERNTEGLLPIRSILENIVLPSWNRYGGLLRMRRAREDATKVTTDLRLVMDSLDAPVDTLSGGNAQKVVLGKWLLRNPEVLLLDDPTKGVDVGAKAEFYSLLANLRERGVTILFYSSDDEELLGLCDRVLVLHDGLVRAELAGPALTRTELVSASLGAEHEARA